MKKAPAGKQASGRKQGSRNTGYCFREGRGWFARDVRQNRKYVPLTDEAGERLRDRNAPGVKEAYARFVVNYKTTATNPASGVTVLQVCAEYLAQAKAEQGENKTFSDRAETLFDFCFGLPAKFRGVDLTPKGKPTRADKVHDGYGALPVAQLTPLHVNRWLQAHTRWNGGKRTHLKALMRALNYARDMTLIPANPIKGFKVPKVNARVTYLTVEQEAAMIEASADALAMAIKVLIRTGMRPGIEFCAMTARHVRDTGERIEVVFQPGETKTKKLRTIYITDPAILAIVRKQVELHPTGKLFRSPRGQGWNVSNLSKRFRDVRVKLAAGGMEFDPDCVLYSTRHTYARRILHGHWSGKPTNIETLAKLMGNSPQICRQHYLQFDVLSNDLVWQSA